MTTSLQVFAAATAVAVCLTLGHLLFQASIGLSRLGDWCLTTGVMNLM